MTLAQLQAAIQAHGYDSSTAADQLVFINNTYRQLHGKARWPFLEAQDTTMSTTAGTWIYAWPMTNWRNIDAVRLTQVAFQGYFNMEYMNPQDFRDLENSYPQPGQPEYWSMIDQKLHIWPPPDGVYNVVIDYIIEPPDLAAPTDIPILPVAYHDILVWGAIKQIAYRERDLYSNEIANGEYQTALQQFQEEYNLVQRQTSARVKKSQGSGRLYYHWHG